MRILKLLTLLLLPSIAVAELPRHKPMPGGIAIVELETDVKIKPKAKFMGKPVAVTKNQAGKWVGVVGVPLSFKGREAKLSVISPESKTITFPVGKRRYRVEKLTISNNRLVSPNNSDLARIKNETKKIKGAFAKWSESGSESKSDILDFKLDRPVEGRLSSPFGLRRIMNGIEKNPHKGLDIAATTGTPILAPKSGKVVLTGNFFYSGNMVVIDHGHGLVTGYSHLSKIKVKNGDSVNRGDVIGQVGKTGRVTGAHLHWSVSLNGEMVNPKLFIDKVSKEKNKADTNVSTSSS